MEDMSWLDWVAFVLVIIGAVNLGLSAFDWGALGWLGGLLKWFNALVGLSGLYLIWFLSK